MSTGRGSFVALVAAAIVSLGGTRLSMIAIPWLVLTTTGNPVLTGIVAFAEMLPYVVAKVLGGPLIDRLGARRIAIACDLGAMLALVTVPLLQATGTLTMFTLVPVVFATGALRGPADAAKESLTPAVAAIAGLPLERVTGTLGTVERLASTIGAAAAGALVAATGPTTALAVNAAGFGLSAAIVGFGIAHLGAASKAAPEAPPGYRRDLREGWEFFRRDPVLVGIVVMVATTNFLDQAYASVLLPVWAQASGHGAAALGLALAIFSGGAVAGSLLATMLGHRLPRLTIYVGAFLIAGVPRFFVFIPGFALPLILAVLVLAGFAAGFLNPILSAVIFERIPAPLVGRVSSLVNALCYTLSPFGGLAGGALVAAIGLPLTFALAGCSYFSATMLPLRLRRFRAFANRPAAPGSSGAAASPDI